MASCCPGDWKNSQMNRGYNGLPGKDAEESEPSYIAGRHIKWYGHYGKTVCQFLEKLHRITMGPSNCTHICPKELKIGV